MLELNRLLGRTESDPNGGCFLWTGSLNRKGYGTCRDGERTLLAHRAVFEALHGPIPAGLHVRHACDVRCCCNPAHLSLGTAAQNNADVRNRGRYFNGRSRSTVSEHTVRLIRTSGLNARQASEKFGITLSAAKMIVSRRTWKVLPTDTLQEPPMPEADTPTERGSEQTAWTAAEVLSRAADLLEPEGAWTKRSFWRTGPRGHVHEDEREPVSTKAKCFCAIGALAKVSGLTPAQVIGGPAYQFLDFVIGGEAFDIAEYNDGAVRTQAEVIAKLRLAFRQGPRHRIPDGRRRWRWRRSAVVICYRDMTFCSAPNCPSARSLTPEVEQAAERWWGQPGAPIAVADFRGHCGCFRALDAAPSRDAAGGGA